jgi:tight adherence protein C
MTSIVLIVVIFLVVVGAIVLVVVGMRDAQKGDALQGRLAEFAARGETASLEDIEMSQSLSERIFLPLARKFGEFAQRFTPQNALQATALKLELAGNPRGLEPATLWIFRFIAPIVIGGVLIFVFSVSNVKWDWGRKGAIIAAAVAMGFYMPEMYLNSIIARRQKAVFRAMPDALDLLTICVEAGMGFEGAIAKVSEKWDNELSMQFKRVIREIQLGKIRREALRDMALRIGLPEMTSFVAAVIQSELLGVSMAKVLRIQSDQMRMKRRQRAEEEAHKAPIKMLLPMGLLIFPSICIVLMAPAVLRLMTTSLQGVF